MPARGPVLIRVVQTAPEPQDFGELALPVTIGKHPACAVYLPSPRVSREHARVDRSEDGVCVTDLGSAARVFRNGEELAPRVAVRLTSGDELLVGDRKLVVTFTA